MFNFLLLLGEDVMLSHPFIHSCKHNFQQFPCTIVYTNFSNSDYEAWENCEEVYLLFHIITFMKQHKLSLCWLCYSWGTWMYFVLLRTGCEWCRAVWIIYMIFNFSAKIGYRSVSLNFKDNEFEFILNVIFLNFLRPFFF